MTVVPKLPNFTPQENDDPNDVHLDGSEDASETSNDQEVEEHEEGQEIEHEEAEEHGETSVDNGVATSTSNGDGSNHSAKATLLQAPYYDFFAGKAPLAVKRKSRSGESKGKTKAKKAKGSRKNAKPKTPPEFPSTTHTNAHTETEPETTTPPPKKTRRRYTYSEKRQIIQAIDTYLHYGSLTLTQACSHIKVHTKNYQKWKEEIQAIESDQLQVKEHAKCKSKGKASQLVGVEDQIVEYVKEMRRRGVKFTVADVANFASSLDNVDETFRNKSDSAKIMAVDRCLIRHNLRCHRGALEIVHGLGDMVRRFIEEKKNQGGAAATSRCIVNFLEGLDEEFARKTDRAKMTAVRDFLKGYKTTPRNKVKKGEVVEVGGTEREEVYEGQSMEHFES